MLVHASEAAAYTMALRCLVERRSGAASARPSGGEGAAASGCSFREPGDAVLLLGPAASLDACLSEASAQGILSSVRVGDGCCLAVALAECCATGGQGALLSFDSLSADQDAAAVLFGDWQGQALISLPKEQLDVLAALAACHKATARCLGMVGGNRLILSECRRILVDLPVTEIGSQLLEERS